jgi:cold shock CspA family protein
MQGKIINYIKDKGYGFILDSGGNKRFFHISDTLNPIEIDNYKNVEFEATENNKGLSCKQIRVMLSEQNKVFINIGNTNIKCSNIKEFGIGKGIIYNYDYLKPIEPVVPKLPYMGEKEIINVNLKYINGEEEEESIYLYIRTYQGDDLKWKGELSELNIILKKIEEALL